MSEAPYPRVHVVINPASGKDEPILNVLNDVFGQHGVAWDISVTHKYGDAGAQARAAIADGVDLVAGYGGDGTQHEIANAVVTAAATADGDADGDPPGGTGNGFAREMGTPTTLRDATELLCTSATTRNIDVGWLRTVGQAQVGRPLLHPAAVRRHRARGADQPRPEGPLRRPGLRGLGGAATWRPQTGPLPRRRGRDRRGVRGLEGLCRQLRDDGNRPQGHPHLRGRRRPPGLLHAQPREPGEHGRGGGALPERATWRPPASTSSRADRSPSTWTRISRCGRTASTSVAHLSRSRCFRRP